MAKLRKGLYKLYLYSDYYYHYHTLFILDEFQNYFYYRKNIIYFGDNRKDTEEKYINLINLLRLY